MSANPKSRTLFTAADANYFTQACVLLKSLSSTQKQKSHLIIFGANWDEKKIEALEALATNFLTVEVKEVDSNKFSVIRLSHGFPLATAYNLIAPKYLLDGYSRAIYMDADVVILEDLGQVWSQELTTPLAAVIDAHVGLIGNPSMWRPWREENSNPKAPYLNTGLMLIDLEAWRESRITEQCIELLKEYVLPCVDQDALNLVLNGNFDHLHPKYNQMPYHLMPRLRYADIHESPEEITYAITNPSMIHFHRSFLGKPWVRGCSHPARKLWTDLATGVNPGWETSNDWMNFAKSKAATLAKMSTLDPSVIGVNYELNSHDLK